MFAIFFSDTNLYSPILLDGLISLQTHRPQVEMLQTHRPLSVDTLCISLFNELVNECFHFQKLIEIWNMQVFGTIVLYPRT